MGRRTAAIERKKKAEAGKKRAAQIKKQETRPGKKPEVTVILEWHTPSHLKKVIEIIKKEKPGVAVIEVKKEEPEKAGKRWLKMKEELEKHGIRVVPGDKKVDKGKPMLLPSMEEIAEQAEYFLKEREKSMAETAIKEAEKTEKPVYLIMGAMHTGVAHELKKMGAKVKIVWIEPREYHAPASQQTRFYRFNVQERYLPEETKIIMNKLEEISEEFELKRDHLVDRIGGITKVFRRGGGTTDEYAQGFHAIEKEFAEKGKTYPYREIRERRKRLDQMLEKTDPEYKKIKEKAAKEARTEEEARLKALKEYRKHKKKEYEKAFNKVYKGLREETWEEIFSE